MELSTRTVEASTAKVRSQHRSATHVARRAKPRAKLLLVHWPILHKSRETCIANARPPIGILSQPSVDRLKRKGGKEKRGEGKKERDLLLSFRFDRRATSAWRDKNPRFSFNYLLHAPRWPVIHSAIQLAYSPIDLLALRCVPCPESIRYGSCGAGQIGREKGTWRSSFHFAQFLASFVLNDTKVVFLKSWKIIRFESGGKLISLERNILFFPYFSGLIDFKPSFERSISFPF